MAGLDLLVVGGRGLAGAALLQAAKARGLSARDLSRHGDIALDVRDEAALLAALRQAAPRTIVNAAAIVSIPDCEADPREAWLVNARPAALLAAYSRDHGARLLQVSTDHFYLGDGARAHREDEPVRLLNEYARTKYAAEALALTDPAALVVRTNIIGLTSATGTSFGEWALRVIEEDGPATLFDNQFCSMIDVWALAEALLDLATTDARGVLNVASREVFSKAQVVRGLAARLGKPMTQAAEGSVAVQSVLRGDSLGLDVGRAEALLHRRLPTLGEVVAAVCDRYWSRN
jgi:dTDP-4-dehydrorhamnose reductase